MEYFSSEGREELVGTIDRLLIAKMMQTHLGKHIPGKVEFYSGLSNDIYKLKFFCDTLVYAFDSTVSFDVEQEPEEGLHLNDMYFFSVQFNELDEIKLLLSENTNRHIWTEDLNTTVKRHLDEVHSDGYFESEMRTHLTDELKLHVEIESAIHCTFSEFFKAFLDFYDELQEILHKMRQEGKIAV